MLSLKDKVKLVDELITENAEHTISDFAIVVREIEKEMILIEDSFKK